MRVRILTLGLVCFIVCLFVQSQGNIVYVNFGEKIFHKEGCNKLGTNKTAMSLEHAINKGYKPCTFCLPEEKKQEQIQKKEETQKKIEKATIFRSGFREATWGMSQEELKKIEKSDFLQKIYSKSSGLDIFTYKGKAGDLDCIIGYYFAEDQLIEGRYLITEKHSNNLLYIKDFLEIKEALTEKYGKPTKDETHWIDDLYKDDSSDWGMALAVGHLVFEVTWKLPKTEIMLQCKGDNFDITLSVDYMSQIKEHVELRKKALEKAKKVIW